MQAQEVKVIGSLFDQTRLQAAVAGPDKRIRYCYCSIFDECWLVDSEYDTQDPQAVASCPDFGADGYDTGRPRTPSP